MANRYWVGGTGNWSSTTKWSLTSGGASGASVPIATDDVIFDTLSGLTGATATVDVASTCNNFTITPSATVGFQQIALTAQLTVNGTLSMSGTAGNRRTWFRSTTYGLTINLSVAVASGIIDADFRNIRLIGTSAPISGTRLGDLGHCSGITFSTPKTVYWNLAGTQNWNATGWATTSGGVPSNDNYPLAQDTGVIDNNSAGTSVVLFPVAGGYIGGLDASARTTAFGISTANGGAVFGNYLWSSSVTNSASLSLTFLGSSMQTIRRAGVSDAASYTVDSYGGGVTLDGAFTTTSTITITNGSFITNNYAVSAVSITSSNSNIRTMTLGSSTITLSGASAITITSTNLTFDAGTSLFSLTYTSTPDITITGGVTFYDMTLVRPILGGTTMTISGTNTFRDLSMLAPLGTLGGASLIQISNNQTITGTLTLTGANPGRQFVKGTTGPVTLTVGTLLADYCDFLDITIAGTAAGTTLAGAGDCGGNSGIVFPAPKTVYWNLGGSSALWYDTGWATTSGGVPNQANLALAQDTAVFDNAGAVPATFQIGSFTNVGTFDTSARTSAMVYQIAGTVNGFGDWTHGSGVTTAAGAGVIRFSKRGTQTITTNGSAINNAITIDSLTGTAQLGSALTISSISTLILTSGTFDAVTYTVTAGLVNISGSTARTLRMGSGLWTITGVGNSWIASTTTNLSLFKGSADITLSNTTTSARTFSGGGLSYNKLTIGGATGTSTLTFFGNNQFTELASTKTVAHTIAFGTTIPNFGRWTVTGSAGNVVTLTGTGTTLQILGAATSGIDYLAMGTIGFSSVSPGEFYAGANSTGTAGPPVYRTAPPVGATRYWVGGTGNWSSTTKWSTTSGGASGASVPTSLDDVVFNSASNPTAYTATVDTTARCRTLTIAGPASGNVTLAGGSAIIPHNNVTFPVTGLTLTHTGQFTLSGSTTGRVITTNGVIIVTTTMFVDGVGCGWSLGSAFTTSSGCLFTVGNGAIDFVTYNATFGAIASSSQNSRSILLGSGTTTALAASGFQIGTTVPSADTLTFSSGSSQINLAHTSPTFSGNGKQFYNVSFTSGGSSTIIINGANTYNNLTFAGQTSARAAQVNVTANQTINGTLTFSAGTNAAMRRFVFSSQISNAVSTITCAAFSGVDVDFRGITIAGAAAPVSGTRFGDVKGNSGITFPSPKTVYCRSTGSALWSATTGWSATPGGSADITQFPLAQDTAIFPSATYPASGSTITIDGNYNLGTVDLSGRTTDTMTLAFGSTTSNLTGDFINGTGVSITGTGTLFINGRVTQTLTTAGATFGTKSIEVTAVNSVFNIIGALNVFSLVISGGVVNTNNYNLTLANLNLGNATQSARTINFGSSNITFSSSGSVVSGVVTIPPVITGTGTMSCTSASAKTFAGAGLSYDGFTVDQGGAGALTITGNNTFANITNSYNTTGATSILLANTTQRVTAWGASGRPGALLTISGTSAAAPGTVVVTGAADVQAPYLAISNVRAFPVSNTWYAGTNSTNAGSLGFDFGFINFDSGITEAGAGVDSSVGLLSVDRAVIEASTGSETVSALSIVIGSTLESATGSETVSSLTSVTSSISELVSASEFTTSAFIAISGVVESSVGSDLAAGVLNTGGVVLESSVGSDVIAGSFSPSVAVSEAVTGSETVTGVFNAGCSVNEASTGSDVVSSLAAFLSLVVEVAVGLDAGSSLVNVYSNVAETGLATDSVSALSIFPTSVTEAGIANDSPFANLYWNPIGDDQVPNWANVTVAQPQTWNSVVDSQIPGWADVSGIPASDWIDVVTTLTGALLLEDVVPSVLLLEDGGQLLLEDTDTIWIPIVT